MWETRTRKLRKRHTPFGSKRTVRDALDRLFDHFSAPQALVVSYGSNADLDAAELEALLGRHRARGASDRDPAPLRVRHSRAPPRGGARPSTCSSAARHGPILRQVQEMVIYGVSFDMVGKQPIVLLKAVDTNKFLPIWIGHPEAAAILMKLQGASTPRPMTHDLLFDMLGELEVACTRVSVTELRENTFYASITLSVNGREVEIDSRPVRRARARRALRRPDLRRRGRDRRVRDRVRARGRGHRRGRRQVQGVPGPRDARGLRRRRRPEVS